jgi:hypothetical protein
MKAKKGAQFEREFCVNLSTWWTRGVSQECFWRSSNSGGRATVRGRKGHDRSNHAGDVAATDPNGHALMKLICFELKRGYNKVHPESILSSPTTAARSEFEKWVAQAISAKERLGSKHWAIVHKKDKHDPVIYLPHTLVADLDAEWSPRNTIWYSLPIKYAGKAVTFSAFRLSSFWKLSPDTLRGLL